MDVSSSASSARQPSVPTNVVHQIAPQMVIAQHRERGENVPYSYLHLLTRISFPTALTSNPPVMPGHDYSRILRLLLQQPPEVQAIVLGFLPPEDLLCLRRTNHASHEAVHQAEQAIRSSFVGRISKSHQLSHIPVDVPNLPTYCQKYHHYQAACDVATIMSERIVSNMRTVALRNDKSGLEVWRKKKLPLLSGILTRCMIILAEYLDFLKQALIEHEDSLRSLDNDEYTTLDNVFDFDQQDFLRRRMSALTEQDFLDVTATITVFKVICKARCVPFKMKGMETPFPTVRQVLIYRGFEPFVKLLAKDVLMAQQEKMMRQFAKDIDQMRKKIMIQGPALHTIHHLQGYMERASMRFDLARSTRAREKFLDHQDMWDRSARALVMQTLGRLPFVESASIWIAKAVCVEEKHTEIMLGSWDQPDRP